MPILDFLPRNAQSFSHSQRKEFWYPTPPQMAMEQGYIFKVAQHQEFITSIWNVGKNGHSTSTVLGLTSQKSNSQPQNGRRGVFVHSFPAPHRTVLWLCLGNPSRDGNVKQFCFQNKTIPQKIVSNPSLVVVPKWTLTSRLPSSLCWFWMTISFEWWVASSGVSWNLTWSPTLPDAIVLFIILLIGTAKSEY